MNGPMSEINFQIDDPATVRQPPQVRLEHHRPVAVKNDDFINAVGELESAILDGDLGLLDRAKCSVEIGEFWHWEWTIHGKTVT